MKSTRFYTFIFILSTSVFSAQHLNATPTQFGNTLRAMINDTTDVKTYDSLSVDDELTEDDSMSNDSLQDSLPPPPKKKWKAQAKTMFNSEKQHDGVSLSQQSATLDFSLKLSHAIGAYLSFTGTQRLGSNGEYQQSALGLGYVYEAAKWCDLSADVVLNKYPNDTVNALAANPATFSVSSDFYTKIVDVGLCIDHYFGTPAANYVSLSLSHDFSLDEDEYWTLTPGLSIAYSASKYKSKKSTLITVRGLSAVVVDCYLDYFLGKGFSCAIDPSLVVSYQRDLLDYIKGKKTSLQKSVDVVVVATLRYALKF